MSTRSALALILAVSLASTPAVADAPAVSRPKACSQLFARALDGLRKAGRVAETPVRKLESVYARMMVGKVFHTFNFEIFDESLTRFRADPELLPSTGLFEEEAAYWEAALERLGPKGSTMSLVPMLRSKDWMTRYEVYRSIRGEAGDPVAYLRSMFWWRLGVRGKLDLEQGVREGQVRRFVNDLYLMHNLEIGPVLRDLFGRESEKLLDEKLERMAMRELETEGLRSFLGKRGLLGEPKIADKLRELQEGEGFALLLTAYLNARYMVGLYPAYVPRADFLREIRKYGPELWEKGLDDVWPKLKHLFRTKQEQQAYFGALRTAWLGIGLVIAGTGAIAWYRHEFLGDEKAGDTIQEFRDKLKERKQELRPLRVEILERYEAPPGYVPDR